jgi:hypothetical protein
VRLGDVRKSRKIAGKSNEESGKVFLYTKMSEMEADRRDQTMLVEPV